MNRLWVRLTLVCVLVTMIGVGAVALLADVNTTSEFRQYVMRQQTLVQSGLVDDLAAYYLRQDTWIGVSDLFASTATPMGRGRGAMRGHSTIVIADQRGQVVYDEGNGRSDRLTSDELAAAEPISVNGAIAGYLLVSAPGIGGGASPEQAFLDQLHRTVVIAGLVAGMFSLILGVAFSRALAQPLSYLAVVAHAFAQHDWRQRIPAGGAMAVTEIAEVSQAINDMADSLQSAETLRRNLIADITHELRTPLTVLQGNLQALMEGVYPLDHGELSILFDQTHVLNRLVDDLHELALAEAGQLPLNIVAIDAAALLTTMAAHFAGTANTQNVTLHVETTPDLPPVSADPDRLEQILQNLLSNALRHTAPGGQVTLRAEIAPGLPAHVMRLSVLDTGAGIAPEELPHVFERFYRGDKSRARLSGGSGLGISIAKTLATAMGGTMGVESKLGEGSCFWLSVPCAQQLPATAAQPVTSVDNLPPKYADAQSSPATPSAREVRTP